MAKTKTPNKYELNIYRAQAIETVARTLTYRLDDVKETIENYRTSIANQLEENPDACVNWESSQLEQALQEEAIYVELFKTLDKMM